MIVLAFSAAMHRDVTCLRVCFQYGDIPWHHVQLYKLYGRAQADAYLYPKVETEKKKSNKPLDPKFQSEGGVCVCVSVC